MLPKKGARAYIVFSHGRAVAVTDKAKEATEIVRGLKARQLDAAKWRTRSREYAEEYAAWHNFEWDNRMSASSRT